MTILGIDLRTMALEESAIEQNPQGLGLEQMLTARDFAGGTEKCQPHRGGGVTTDAAIAADLIADSAGFSPSCPSDANGSVPAEPIGNSE